MTMTMKTKVLLMAFVVLASCKSAEYTYNFKGKTIQGIKSQTVWVGTTAVMNSDDGSFQVLFDNKPTGNKSYSLAEYASGSSSVSISLIADNNQNFYYSTNQSGGSVSVTSKGDNWVIEIKGVNVCVTGSSNCGKISGVMVVSKYDSY